MAVNTCALNYVWGSPQSIFHEAVRKAQGTISRFPRTVADDMIVVLRLNHRFLWVDKYCISENANEKHAQIASMNRVYAGAYVTLVSTTPDATCGLPVLT